MSNADSRVQAGAQLLDETKPGWFEEVNMDELDISKSRYCVLGQIYGDYETGLSNLHLSIYNRDRISDLGFVISESLWFLVIKSIFRMKPWDALKRAWKKEIADRQAQVA